MDIKLTDQICRQISKPVPPAIKALSDKLLANYGKAVEAILFYGSCLRTGDDRGGLVDLYVIVDRYRSAESKRFLAALNKLLPPNVFYLEVPFENRIVRAKYALLSLTDFKRGTSRRWFHSYIWGRFAQPVGLLYARNDRMIHQVHASLAQAVLTFITRVLPRVSSPFSAHDLWRKGLELSYRAELRAERPEKLVRLLEASPNYYEQITRSAMAAVSFEVDIKAGGESVWYTLELPQHVRIKSRLDWLVRRWQGKVLSVLRLLKGLLTFRGGIDYILWKIERHSGVKVEVPLRLKRYPLLATCVIFWKLYRQGAYR
jgi:predicted nucleotidyltransferase